MADGDDFDIDIYGEDPAPEYQEPSLQDNIKHEDTTEMHDSHAEQPTESGGEVRSIKVPEAAVKKESTASGTTNGDAHHENATQQIASTGGANDVQLPKQAPQQQGMKRKQGEVDDRPLDPGATAALTINDLNWWISEEDIRGWANQSGCEDELIDITFNEHKVNGKSKGWVAFNFRVIL
jgi:hypothetical protein